MVSKNLYVWKAAAGSDEVSLGEIVQDRFGGEKRIEHLTLHVDSMLVLFDVQVYRQIADLAPEDDPIPLTLSIGVEDEAPHGVRRFQAPSAAQRSLASSTRYRHG